MDGRTDRQTDGRRDGRTQPSALSPRFAVDKDNIWKVKGKNTTSLVDIGPKMA